jgi:hypothetical protein
VSYKRTILNKDGRTTNSMLETKYLNLKTKSRELQIKQGISAGNTIVFKDLGNEFPG